MNSEQLEIAKSIAEIEGVNFHKATNNNFGFVDGMDDIYNPFDWSILGPLMIKYEVEPAYWLNAVSIDLGCGNTFTLNYKDKSDIPTAILECIIKSKEVIK